MRWATQTHARWSLSGPADHLLAPGLAPRKRLSPALPASETRHVRAMVLSGRVWLHLLWPGGVVTWFVTGNRPLYALSGALGVVDTDGEVVPLQTQLGAFDEPEFGDALA